MIDTVTKAYPNFKVIATTLRTVKTATVNEWKAICWADERFIIQFSILNLKLWTVSAAATLSHQVLFTAL